MQNTRLFRMQQNKRKYKYKEAKGRQQKYNEKDYTKLKQDLAVGVKRKSYKKEFKDQLILQLGHN